MATTKTSTLTVELPAALAAALADYAATIGRSADFVVAAALAALVSSEDDGTDFSSASQAALTRIWDNDQDAIYDNWKELYGVTQG